MLFVFITVLLCYTIMMILFIIGWNKLTTKYSIENDPNPGELISVLVPARNEATNIHNLLIDLSKQNDSNFEVIVINDHSDDNTNQVVKDIISGGFDNLKIVSLVNGAGKKKALELGVSEANGSIIVTTDADCRVSHRWVSTFRNALADDSVRLAFGGVRIRQIGTLWSSTQAMELASLIGSGASLSFWSKPIMCNGANLAYRKKDFLALNGYVGNHHIASGDDAFLLKKINHQHPGAIRFISDPHNVVETKGVTLSDFIQQRLRWAGKWKNDTITLSTFLALFIFTFHVTCLAMIGWSVAKHNFIFMVVWFAIKIFLEMIFLRKVMEFLRSSWSWRAFSLLTMAYSFYVVFFGIMSNLMSPRWKGRKIHHLKFKIESGLIQNR